MPLVKKALRLVPLVVAEGRRHFADPVVGRPRSHGSADLELAEGALAVTAREEGLRERKGVEGVRLLDRLHDGGVGARAISKGWHAPRMGAEGNRQ